MKAQEIPKQLYNLLNYTSLEHFTPIVVGAFKKDADNFDIYRVLFQINWNFSLLPLYILFYAKVFEMSRKFHLCFLHMFLG